MSEYLAGVLGLLDSTIRALLGIPIFAFFLSGSLLFAVLGLLLLLKDAASGRVRRGLYA